MKVHSLNETKRNKNLIDILVHISLNSRIVLFLIKNFNLFCVVKGNTGLYTEIDALYFIPTLIETGFCDNVLYTFRINNVP